MRAGLNEADRSRGAAFLQTTRKSRRLCEKMGFVEVHSFELDVPRSGVDGKIEVLCLKRESAKERQWAIVDICGVPFRIEHD